eukprot:jgi/Chrzof1/3406/Cz12g24050.t1
MANQRQLRLQAAPCVMGFDVPTLESPTTQDTPTARKRSLLTLQLQEPVKFALHSCDVQSDNSSCSNSSEKEELNETSSVWQDGSPSHPVPIPVSPNQAYYRNMSHARALLNSRLLAAQAP